MKASILNDSFVAPWWAKNRHLQTVWGSLFRRLPALPEMKRKRLELEDGDFIDVDIYQQENVSTLFLLHGLEGSINSPYIRGMIDSAKQKGWQIIIMHFRSCSGEPNRLQQSYHSGVSHDLQSVVDLLAKESINIDYMIGYSLGGNVLLKWLGEAAGNSSIKAAVAVSVPLMLDICATEINQGFSKIYEMVLLRTLRIKTKRKIEKFGSAFLSKIEDVKKLDSFWKFDQQVTAPVHGFKSAKDYYEKSSSRQFVKNIKIPTLIIQSLDDPFMSPEVLPEVAEMPSYVTLEKNSHGGHVGFVEGKWPWRAEYYLEKRIPSFLESKQ